MVRVLTKLLLTIPIALSSVLAGEYYVSPRAVFSAPGPISHFTPLRTTDGAVAGFVIADRETNTITVAGSYRWGDLSLTPDSTVCGLAARLLGNEDSLAIYAATVSARGVDLYRYIVANNAPVDVHRETFDFGFDPKHDSPPWCQIRFAGTLYGVNDLVILSIVDTIPARPGPERMDATPLHRSYVVTADLKQRVQEWHVSRLRAEPNRLITVGSAFDRYAIWTQFSLESTPEQYVRLVDTHSGLNIGEYQLDFASVDQVEAIDLLARYEGTELVVAGRGRTYGDRDQRASEPRLAALAEASGRVFELWTEPYPNLTSVAPFLVDGRLVVMLEKQALITLDPTSGFQLDSLSLPQPIDRVQYYCPKGQSESLHLAGLTNDELVVYRLDPPVASAVTPGEEPDVLPETFELLPSYPNPFNGATQLRFTNKAAQHLTLRIFNVLGQEIRTIVESFLGVGDYDYTWDAKDNFGNPQPTGIYFAQLKSETESHIIKLIYLK